MSLNINQQTKTFDPIPKGTHLAILYSIVDLGTHEIEWKGTKKLQAKVRFTFELPNETKEFNGVIKPVVIGSTYTLSLGASANLRPVVEGLLGTSLTDAEASDFNIERFRMLLGTPCLLNVVHTPKDGRIYANIGSVVPLPKGMTVPKQFNSSVLFDLSDKDEAIYMALPQFLKDKIKESKEAKEEVDDKSNDDVDEDEINPEDIPF